MKAACLFGHHWDGCTCTRCEATRDEQHEWVVEKCRQHCRKCNLPGEMKHHWEGCRCRDCGMVAEDRHQWERCRCKTCGLLRHQWLAGVCTVCGEQCVHPESVYSFVMTESDHTAHSSRVKTCKTCGAVLKS